MLPLAIAVGMDKPSIRIFKSGTFTDIHGQTLSFGAAELQQIVSSYDAESDPAPLVLGHPKMDDPAWGWVAGLKMDGDTMVAEPADVVPEFADAVRDKRYRKVSASFYPPKHPANPKPGNWYLKHVGFLGAMPPAVKGLGSVSFSEADDDAAFTLSFAEEPIMADTPTVDEQALADRIAALDAREAELATREQTAEQRETAFAEAENERRHGENVAFAEGLIAGGKLAPIGKATIVGLMDVLGSSVVTADATVSFGEGDAAQTPLAAFRSLFDTAAPVVALGEAAAPEAPGTVLTVNFAAPTGYTFNQDEAALTSRAKELQAAEPGLDFWNAYQRVRAEARA